MSIDFRENANYTVYVHILPKAISGYEWDKYYVGITKLTTKQRWRDGKGYKGCLLFNRAIEKYSWEIFEHEIVASSLTEDEAKKMEIALIRELKSNDKRYGYNMTKGGDGSLGMPCPKKARESASKRFKEYWKDPEFRLAHSGKNAFKNRSEIPIKRGCESPIAKKIICLNTKKEYGCIQDAANEINRYGSTITANCVGDTRYAGIGENGEKLVWAYKEDYEKMTQEEIDRKVTIANKRYDRMVVNLDTNEYFTSTSVASKKYNIKSHNGIYNVCKGKTKTCAGCHWLYYTDYLKQNNLTNEEAQQRLFFVA